MVSFNEKLKAFAVELYKVDAVKFGEFKTKVGLMTPVYCDLRVLVSHPKLMETLATLLIEYLEKIKNFNLLCGVPYTALPIATVVSIKTAIPMVMRRSERNTTAPKNAIVLLNREQGGAKILENNGIKMHALLSLTELMQFLREADCIDHEMVSRVKNYLAGTQVDVKSFQKVLSEDRLKMSFLARAKLAKNPVAAELFQIMATKQTNLCVAADVTNSVDLLNLAELVEIAERHNFILFEDRKFADIGKTVELQYSKGIYKISSWAKLVTAHSLTGKGVLDAIKGSEDSDKRGVFLLAETSAAGSLITADYTKATLTLAEEYPELIAGIVCQSPLFLANPGLIQLTPGVQLESKSDSLGQQYNTPESIVLDRGADVAVVGRGITKAMEKEAAAKKYKDMLWASYSKRIEQ
ncbi:hypothetical protein NQ318_014052 [Aromia moschata]|uniref:Orotidine 5'-phosphate decarboxylase n=1 Tax=Aromia moschata TaxID=1265417 RepID=A0AAV8YYQ1_9CUCU|nr:hypothetical protein NQ318_014052 [Aromia moschata]